MTSTSRPSFALRTSLLTLLGLCSPLMSMPTQAAVDIPPAIPVMPEDGYSLTPGYYESATWSSPDANIIVRHSGGITYEVIDVLNQSRRTVIAELPQNAYYFAASTLSKDGSTLAGSIDVVAKVYAGVVDLNTGTAWQITGPNGSSSAVSALNGNGTVAVGYWRTISGERAFIWSRNTDTATELVNGNLPVGYSESRAYAVNSAGNIVAGSLAGNTSATFRWKESDNQYQVIQNNPHTVTSPIGISDDGTVILARAQEFAGNAALRWTEANNSWENLGSLDGQSNATPAAMNATGNVVVGSVMGDHTVVDDVIIINKTAFRWQEGIGMQSVTDWLEDSGISVDRATFQPSEARNVSDDGNTVLGYDRTGDLFIARLGRGAIAMEQFNAGLYQTGLAAISQITQPANMVLMGAHGSPMRGLIGRGQQYVWSTGDWGRADTPDSNHANMGSIEIGYARGFTDSAMGKISLGRTFSRQDTDFDGRTYARGTYIMPEATFALGNTSLWTTLSAYYGFGEADIRRGYLNAGVQTHAEGKPDQRTWGLQARIDWLNAFERGSFALTPFAALLYTHAKVDGYTESGQGFPVKWDAQKQKSTLARLGVDATYALNESVTLLGRATAVHRFERRTSDISGDIINVSPFSFEGMRQKQNWMIFGLGAEAQLGRGSLQIMGNTTTETDGLRHWGSITYRLPF